MREVLQIRVKGSLVMEYARRVLHLIASIEGTLSQLYRVYAERLPSQSEFWQRLAEDELRHQEWAEELVEMDAQGLLTLSARRAEPEVYEEYRHFLGGTVQRAQQDPLSALDALATAHMVEQTYIERNLLRVVQTDSPGVQRILDALGKSTERHAAVIAQELEKVRALA